LNLPHLARQKYRQCEPVRCTNIKATIQRIAIAIATLMNVAGLLI
jgi:hypothetical protein